MSRRNYAVNRENAEAMWGMFGKVDDPDVRCARCDGDGEGLGLVPFPTGEGRLPGMAWHEVAREPRCARCSGSPLFALLYDPEDTSGPH
jgi:hypothetical protein